MGAGTRISQAMFFIIIVALIWTWIPKSTDFTINIVTATGATVLSALGAYVMKRLFMREARK